MNKREFLKALAALPPEYKPSYEGQKLRYLIPGERQQWFCPLTALANEKRPLPLSWGGSLDCLTAAKVLEIPGSLRSAVVVAADDNPHWYDGLFKRRVRRIFRKQFAAAYPYLTGLGAQK